MSKKDPTSTTNPTTDTEAGVENLSEEEDRAQSIRALKSMYGRGLIPEGEFQKRLKELEL